MRLISEFKDSVKFVIAAISIVLATYFFVIKNTTIPFLLDKIKAQKFYNVFSKYYDLLNPFVYTFDMRKEVVRMLNSKGEDVILELGCGTGYTTEGVILHNKFKILVALDLNKEQLKRAKAKIKHPFVSFVRGDSYYLPFRSFVFDGIITAGMIEYINYPVYFFKEATRVIKNSGTFVIAGPEYKWFSKFGISRFFYTPRIEEMVLFYKNFGYANIQYKLLGPKTYFKTEKYAFSIKGDKYFNENEKELIIIQNANRI
jgi:Methylase involved in ubiquinone/menaquinone biosynthesis